VLNLIRRLCVTQGIYKTVTKSPASHRRDSGAFTLQSMWDLWLTKWHWDKILFQELRPRPDASYPFSQPSYTSNLSNGKRRYMTHKWQVWTQAARINRMLWKPPYNSLSSFISLKNKNQLDVTYCFIILVIGSTCFGHHYAHHQELTTIMLVTTWAVRFLVCCWLEVKCSQSCRAHPLHKK